MSHGILSFSKTSAITSTVETLDEGDDIEEYMEYTRSLPGVHQDDFEST
jgi:hypothetical protein